MSRELYFYPAYQDSDTGKFKNLLTDVTGKPADIFWRSASFIDMDYFTNELPMLKRSDFDESCREYFVGTANYMGEPASDDDPTYIYDLSLEDLVVAADDGILSGYVPIKDAEGYYASDEPEEYIHWCMETPIPAELYAELPEAERTKYVKFSALDRYSTGYVCNLLMEILDSIWLPYEYNAEKHILVRYSF